MPKAARVTDKELCPSGGAGLIATGAPNVYIEDLNAARVGDALTCPGGPTVIESGSPNVTIEGAKAARVTDTTCHKGAIMTGAATVFINEGGAGRSTTLDFAHARGTPFVSN